MYLGGEIAAGEKFEQVSEVVSGVEAQPGHVWQEDQPGGHEQLSEVVQVDASPLVPL